MTNALTYKHNLAHVLKATDSVVDLGFDWRPDLWPWLALPPAHPVVVEKYQYFATMTASWAMGTFSPETYTALTMFEWHCGEAALRLGALSVHLLVPPLGQHVHRRAQGAPHAVELGLVGCLQDARR